MDYTVMKKSILFLLFAIVPIMLWADPVEINGIYYNLIEKGNFAEVTKNPNKYTGSVVIPESVNYNNVTYSVTSIGSSAFAGSSELISISIPNSISRIVDFAFSNCSGLTSVTIPNSVTSIGKRVFQYCTSLTSINIPSGVTSIGQSVFQNCESLSSITIPNSVTSIGVSAFEECSALTSITIPNSVMSIGEGAFRACKSLASINISNSVTLIEKYLFEECSALTSVTIPNGVTHIRSWAFLGCSSLKSVTIPNSVTSIESESFSKCSSLTTVNIPNSVKNVGIAAFSGCSSLTTVTIPNSLTGIDWWTFAGCSSLTTVTIPNSVTGIGMRAFQNCSNLKTVTIGNGIEGIGECAFEKCVNLKDVYCYADSVPNTVIDAFKDSYTEYATLYVPSESVNAYKAIDPWKSFGNVVALSGETPTTQKCETPTISYENGELKMACATEGVEYVTDIADADIKKHYSSEITLSATYNISVYATKAGFENSEVVTATLCWIDAEPKTEGITNGVANVNARAVLIQNNGGIITINGVEDGMRVSAYSLNGVEEAATISRNGAAVLNTNAQTGSTVIVKMGEKSVKVLMK